MMTQQAVPHILVVDDDDGLASAVCFNLEQEGYKTSRAENGEVAVKMVIDTALPYDLIVLDVMMPVMSGYEFCEWFRKRDQATPVLILSARTLREDQARGFDVGANQYMLKPFDLGEFVARVKNLLRMGTSQVATQPREEEPDTMSDSSHKQVNVEDHKPVARTDGLFVLNQNGEEVAGYEFGDAKIDFQTYEATVDGKMTKLTSLEMKLLHYFIVNAGRVISRHELLEGVWEIPGDVKTRTPDQFLRRLRKLFEKDPSKPRFFITVRDAGYRFISDG